MHSCTFIKIDKHKESSWALEWSWGQIKCTAAWFSDTHTHTAYCGSWREHSRFLLPLYSICWYVMMPDLLVQQAVTKLSLLSCVNLWFLGCFTMYINGNVSYVLFFHVPDTFFFSGVSFVFLTVRAYRLLVPAKHHPLQEPQRKSF